MATGNIVYVSLLLVSQGHKNRAILRYMPKRQSTPSVRQKKEVYIIVYIYIMSVFVSCLFNNVLGVVDGENCFFRTLFLQIIELLAYALVLSGNHVFTSGAMGTNAATIRYGLCDTWEGPMPP